MPDFDQPESKPEDEPEPTPQQDEPKENDTK